MKSQLKKLRKQIEALSKKLNPEPRTMLVAFQNPETKAFEYNGRGYQSKQELEAENSINQKILYIEFV